MTATEDTRQRYQIILDPDQEEIRSALNRFLMTDDEFEIVSEVATGLERVATVNNDCVDLITTNEPGTGGRHYTIRFVEAGLAPRIEHVSIELIHAVHFED
ncbi:MAG TPA: hypothetical protein VE174_14245 [Actinomycetota bacterium]|nr:hypothetical protein [Actinomycetota bacterium]